MPNCAICGSSQVDLLLRLNRSPLLQAVLYESLEEIDRQQSLDLAFYYCQECHFAFNPDFRSDLVAYDARYNNNQSCSRYYRDYLASLASTLATACALAPEKSILEIGCGNACFLRLLKDITGSETVVGYDPAYAGQHGMDRHVVRELFRGADSAFDLVVLRHCFESIPNYRAVVESIRPALKANGRCYIEITSLDYLLGENDPTLFCHEYHSYYSLKSISLILERAGLRVTHCLPLFDGQYCGILARPGISELDIARNLGAVKRCLEESERPLVWGVSGRAVNLLNHLGLDNTVVRYAVDIDPAKQGRFVPFTRQQVISPAQAADYGPDLVLVMNRNYLAEIREMLPEGTRFLTVDGVIHAAGPDAGRAKSNP